MAIDQVYKKEATEEENAVRRRIKNAIGTAAPILILAVLDLGVFVLTGRGIPCLIRLFTGFQCPGCGMTHAFAALFSGDLRKAAEYNALSLGVLPVAGGYLFFRAVRYVRNGSEGFRVWEYFLLVLLLAVTLGYGIMRNGNGV